MLNMMPPHPGPKYVTSRTEPSPVYIRIPIRCLHQIETFKDGTERHSLQHPNGALFVARSYRDAVMAMRQAFNSK